MRYRIVFFILAVSFGCFVSVEAKEVDFNNASWNKVLENRVKNGRVDYQGLLKNPQHLNDYIREISQLERGDYQSWSEAHKIAFWLNVYNASMINLVLQHYPIKKGLSWKALSYPENSVQQIPNVWERDVIRVFGETMSLNEIEHRTIRKEFSEPRIHFGLVCASIGCPVIRDEPYRGEVLDQQLDEQTRFFLKDLSKNRIQPEGGYIYISPIFKWFSKDFKKHSGSVVNYLAQYNADIRPDHKVKYLDYDWSLNEQGAV